MSSAKQLEYWRRAEAKRKPLEPRPCVRCENVFTPSRGNRLGYCSKRCILLARIAADPEYPSRVSKQTAKARGDAQRGSGEGRTYRKRDGRHEHRVVAEQKLGRALQPGEIVHHIDGNKLNNHPDNLEVMTQGEHMREHGLGIPGKKLTHKPWTFRKTKEAQ